MSHTETERLRLYSQQYYKVFKAGKSLSNIGQRIIKKKKPHLCLRPKRTRCGQNALKTPKAPFMIMKILDFSFQSISLKINNKARPLTRLAVTINHFLTHVIEK